MQCIICSETILPKPNFKSEERNYVWNKSGKKDERSISICLRPFHYPTNLCYCHEKMASGLLSPDSAGAFVDFLRAKRIIGGEASNPFTRSMSTAESLVEILSRRRKEINKAFQSASDAGHEV